MRRLLLLYLVFLGIIFLAPLDVQAAITCLGEERAGVCFPTDTGLSQTSVSDLLLNMMNWLLGIVGVIAIIAFVISGLQYFLAAGDEKMAETAKRNMQYAAIGVIVALSGLVIITAIDQALKAAPRF